MTSALLYKEVTTPSRPTRVTTQFTASAGPTTGSSTEAGSGNDTIIGDCSVNTGSGYNGGHNTIYAGSGNHTIYGDCVQSTISSWQGGFDTYVFRPETGQVTIEDFDQHAGSAFSHAQGDLIDVSAYHLNPTFGPGGVDIARDPYNSNNALVILPPATNHYSTITLVGVQAANLELTDFHF